MPVNFKTACSIVPDMRDSLLMAFAPFIGKPFDQENTEILAKIVKDHIAPEYLDMMASGLRTRGGLNAYGILNVPVISREDAIKLVETEGERKMLVDGAHCIIGLFTQGLFGALDFAPGFCGTLLRSNDDKPPFQGDVYHRDNGDVSGLAGVLANGSRTVLSDLQGVLESLSAEVRGDIAIPAQGRAVNLNSAQPESLVAPFARDFSYEERMIFKNEAARRLWREARNENSVAVLLEGQNEQNTGGTLVVYSNTGRLYHMGENGVGMRVVNAIVGREISY